MLESTEKNKKYAIVFMFDSGKIDESFYGDKVFEHFISGKEITRNKYKTIFSLGDIIDTSLYTDINPFLIRDDLCTIKSTSNDRFKDLIFAFLVEDIEKEIAYEIDKRLFTNTSFYVGMTRIDVDSTDTRKQFWKNLVRRFSIEHLTVTSFNSVEEGGFGYNETAVSNGFNVISESFNNESDFSCNENLYSTRQSSFIQNFNQLSFKNGKNDSDRGILHMNFALVKEVNVAGIQIWKSIEDISNAIITKNDNDTFFIGQIPTEYIFTSLYQASQGVERLLKVILELIMYGMEESKEKEKITNLLMGHNHPAMLDYIKNKENILIKPIEKNIINLLYNFYNKARYHRYTDSSTDVMELVLLRSLGKDLDCENFDKKIKHLYGKAIGTISQSLYELINVISNRLNIYVYEIPSNSTSAYVFYSFYEKDLYSTLEKITLAKKELIWYLMNNCSDWPSKECIEHFNVLNFGDCGIEACIKDLISSGNSNYQLFEFVNYEYDELVNKDKQKWKERTEAIDCFIGNTDFYDFLEESDEIPQNDLCNKSDEVVLDSELPF